MIELPYYSLASGFLTGKYRPGTEVESSRAGGASKYLSDPRNVRLLEVLERIAKSHDVSVPALALAWLREQPTVGAPIASARTADQLRPFFERFERELSAAELSELSAVTAPADA